VKMSEKKAVTLLVAGEMLSPGVAAELGRILGVEEHAEKPVAQGPRLSRADLERIAAAQAKRERRRLRDKAITERNRE
jgi:hypothetical protein